MGFAKSTEARERTWKPVLRSLFTKQEEDVWEAVKRVYGTMLDHYEGWSRKKVEAALTKDQRMDEIDRVIMEWVDTFKAEGTPILTGTYAEAGEKAAAMMGVSFELENPLAVEYLEARSIQFATLVNRSTSEEIRASIGRGLMDGESIEQLSKRVAEYFDQARDYRTDRIARTETISSTNAGSFDGYKQAGVEKKAWLSARDPATREDHLQLDSQYSEDRGAIPMDEPFRIGNASAMYPGEFGDPAQDINCRCTFIPVVPED